MRKQTVSIDTSLHMNNNLKIQMGKTSKNTIVQNILILEPWSLGIGKKKLKWLGHIARMEQTIPVYHALQYAQKPFKQALGWPTISWLTIGKRQLQRELSMVWGRIFELVENQGHCTSLIQAELIQITYICGRPTCYSNRLHDFSVIIPTCYRDGCVNSFFHYIPRFWNSLPAECFPLTCDLC